MKNTVIYLLGFAGVGKLTVAKELITHTGARLVDNHIIANPIFSITDHGQGNTHGVYTTKDEFQKKRLERRVAIRNIVLDSMVDLAHPDTSFILTNVLCVGENDWYDPVLDMANKRKARFFPILLTCSPDENKKRIQGHGRKENFKTTNPSNVDIEHNIGSIQFSHPHKLEIDTTHLTPTQTADLILKHIKNKS